MWNYYYSDFYLPKIRNGQACVSKLKLLLSILFIFQIWVILWHCVVNKIVIIWNKIKNGGSIKHVMQKSIQNVIVIAIPEETGTYSWRTYTY